MRYALIGCGRIATNHIKAMLNTDLNLVALCDIMPDKGRDLLDKHGMLTNNIQIYSDYKKMLKELNLDLVTIATPSGTHSAIACDCIEAGVHCIIEKPMAMSVQEADRIVNLAAKKAVKVTVCHQNRFNIAVQKVRHAVEAGRFGKISHGTIHVRWNRNEAYYLQAPWRGLWDSDGGALMNQCIHGIDLLRWLMNDEPVEIYGQTRQRLHGYIEAEDVGVAVVQFAHGALATIEGTTNVYPRNLEESLYLFGERGTVKLGGTSANNIDVWEFADVQEEDQSIVGLQEKTPNVYGNGHINLYADMIEAIRKDRNPYITAVDGRNALEMVLAVYMSQKLGSPVKLPLEDFCSRDMKDIFS